MPDIAVDWPRKTRELHNHHMDSTVWNDFPFRDDDIIIGTYAKSGTTWTQQIVAQLLFDGPDDLAVSHLSPWWDMRVVPPEVRSEVLGQPHRRALKTHLPADALVLSPKAKYIYIGRDGRDVVFSLHNHHSNFSALGFQMINDSPGRVGPPLPKADPDIQRYFRTWLEQDGYPYWSMWENVASWWAVRHLPNVRLVHFANLKKDLEGEMRGIADFLGIDVPQASWPRMVEHCTFEWMKSHADLVSPLGGAVWDGGGNTFIHKGTNGRWRDVLSREESQKYEATAVERLGAECAHWLQTGELA
jgi:aryl sulfotransferase